MTVSGSVSQELPAIRAQLERVIALLHDVSDGLAALTEVIGNVVAAAPPPEPVEPRATPGDDKLLTIKEAAELLGVGVATLYGWRSGQPGGPPSMKIGRHVRYRRSDLERYFQSVTRDAIPPSSAGQAWRSTYLAPQRPRAYVPYRERPWCSGSSTEPHHASVHPGYAVCRVCNGDWLRVTKGGVLWKHKVG